MYILQLLVWTRKPLYLQGRNQSKFIMLIYNMGILQNYMYVCLCGFPVTKAMLIKTIPFYCRFLHMDTYFFKIAPPSYYRYTYRMQKQGFCIFLNLIFFIMNISISCFCWKFHKINIQVIRLKVKVTMHQKLQLTYSMSTTVPVFKLIIFNGYNIFLIVLPFTSIIYFL